MTEARFTVAGVIAERPDMQPTGEFYVELATTGAVVAAIPPHGRRQVASFLQAILARAPLAHGEAYEAHRAILGALRYELETAAIAGALEDPSYVVAEADLREPGTALRERELIRSTRDWAATERDRRAVTYHEHVDGILTPEGEHVAAQAGLEVAIARAETFLASPEADDASAWLA